MAKKNEITPISLAPVLLIGESTKPPIAGVSYNLPFCHIRKFDNGRKVYFFQDRRDVYYILHKRPPEYGGPASAKITMYICNKDNHVVEFWGNGATWREAIAELRQELKFYHEALQAAKNNVKF